jgi:hypothetical protein
MTVTASEATTQVTDELPCAACGYLLRGLDPAQNCPECNHPIAASIETHKLLPARRALRALRRGAIAMLVAIAAIDLPEWFAFSDYHPNFRGHSINADGTRYLGIALLLLPAAWWLSRTEPGDTKGSRWRRRVTIALPVFLIFLAALMYVLLRSYFWRLQNGFLLSSYLLAPIVVAIEIILLFGILARRARDIPRGPNPWWMRIPQWTFGGLLLITALVDAPVTIARILKEYGWYEPPPDRFIPDWLDATLRRIVDVKFRMDGPVWWLALIALLFYIIMLFHRTRVAAR